MDSEHVHIRCIRNNVAEDKFQNNTSWSGSINIIQTLRENAKLKWYYAQSLWTVKHFQFAEIAISPDSAPIYVNSKDFPELMVRLDKILISTTDLEA